MRANKNILVACEESQAVCLAFRERGFNAYSCDLKKSGGGAPQWHIIGDAFNIIKDKGGITERGSFEYVNKWDLVIAHPPCTYLSGAGNRWLYDPADKKLPPDQRRPHPLHLDRVAKRESALAFFKRFFEIGLKRVAVENPTGYINTAYRKPNQIIQPYYFGDQCQKRTGLWLHGLPPLMATQIVDKGNYITLKSGKKVPAWYNKIFLEVKDQSKRAELRSKTFKGIADAMADQWGDLL